MKNNIIESTLNKILATHLSLTIFQNTPDTLVPSIAHFLPGWGIPQWRFFAPTPGTSNHHIFYRSCKDSGEKMGDWIELCPSSKSTLLAAIWNPRSRYIKANFDLASSLINLVSYGATFDYIKISESYILISSIIDERVRNKGDKEYQFMIATTVPEANEEYSFEPKLFSEVLKVK